MKCAAMVAALARADCAVYGDLVTKPDGPLLRRYRQDQPCGNPLLSSVSVYDRPATPDFSVCPLHISDREEVCSCTPRQRREEEAQLRTSQQGE
eukprot:907266-Prorocentrum_minimum.AAC.1